MDPRQDSFEGKVAIVTGAGRTGNIGTSIAYALASAGAYVMVTGRRATELEAIVEEFTERGLTLGYTVADLRNEGDISHLFEETVSRFGLPSILVNCASILGDSDDGRLDSLSAEVWDSVFEVNARGTMLVCKHAIPLMIKNGGGSIVNLVSGCATAGNLRYTAYACSKGSVEVLTKYIATQYGTDGIRCNALSLGLIETSRVSEVNEDVISLFRKNCLLGRCGYPVDVARAVLFLADEKNGYLDGAVIPLDGGTFAHSPLYEDELGLDYPDIW